MTLEEIRHSDKATLTCGEVSELIGCKPYTLHQAAVKGTLPFPALVMGNRVRFPRVPFVHWITGSA